MSKVTVDISMIATSAELTCINCVLNNDIYFKEVNDGDDVRSLKMGSHSFEDNSCDQCGCNTFDVKLFYLINLK